MDSRFITKWIFCVIGGVLSLVARQYESTKFEMPDLAPKKVSVKMRNRAVPQSVAVQSKKILPIKSEQTAKSPNKRVPRVEPLVIETLGLPLIAQPALPLPEIPITPFDNLPPVPAGTPPDTASAQIVKDEPGGNVLVLGLVLNDQAIVVDSRIIVPSDRPLEDLTMNFAVLGQKWSGIQPPLQPGERRVLELRIPYAKPTSIIP